MNRIVYLTAFLLVSVASADTPWTPAMGHIALKDRDVIQEEMGGGGTVIGHITEYVKVLGAPPPNDTIFGNDAPGNPKDFDKYIQMPSPPLPAGTRFQVVTEFDSDVNDEEDTIGYSEIYIVE